MEILIDSSYLSVRRVSTKCFSDKWSDSSSQILVSCLKYFILLQTLPDKILFFCDLRTEGLLSSDILTFKNLSSLLTEDTQYAFIFVCIFVI